MPRGVRSRIQVGTGTRTYSFREIAEGAGLSLSLVSLIFNRKRRITPYAAMRLTSFLGISIEQLFTAGTIKVHTPRLRRPLGRAVYRITPNTMFPYGRPPVLDRHAQSELLRALQESEPPLPGTGKSPDD